MTRFIFTTLLVLGSCSLLAQQKVHEIKIKRTFPLKNKAFYCNKIIDARTTKGNIGYVLTKATRKRVTAQFEQDFVLTLEWTVFIRLIHIEIHNTWLLNHTYKVRIYVMHS